MEQNVMISMCGEQDYAGQEKDTIEFATEGVLRATGYGYLLEYDESELTGMAGSRTAVQLHASSAALLRSGAFRSRMIFEPGKQHRCLYQTPYGSVKMDITTHSLRATITERGGELDILYDVALDLQPAGQNRFHLTVRPLREKEN